MDRARPADLVQRVEAASLATGAQGGGQRLGRFPEERRAEVVCRGSKVGVVEDVEEIPSRLKGKPVEDLELSARRQIDLRRAEAARGILEGYGSDRSAGRP